ncbi:AN1-type zinc finger protein 1-like [Sinocyclocheilus grahami]|uniref:AN1-type zinc finger protein 1-like n=1 Tax=Sinocyclocheilus grahami TaxID=75366 RepID=UPI0007ACCB6F|nr:PREDICTED: AN1-type zinc finger protein 1-like [Sinocyclocheilus grahami]
MKYQWNSCDIKSCNNKKDFLPFACSSCSGVFCTSYPCSFEDCKEKERLPVIRPHFEKHLCLTYRHQDDHKCEKLETPKPRIAATQELVQKIVESKKNAPPSKRRKGAKNAATAAKVALMKLKMHASGDKDLPQTERTYFQVFLPKEAKDPSLPMFFFSKWSVGKVEDFAASQASLKNNNNVLTAKAKISTPNIPKTAQGEWGMIEVAVSLV